MFFSLVLGWEKKHEINIKCFPKNVNRTRICKKTSEQYHKKSVRYSPSVYRLEQTDFKKKPPLDKNWYKQKQRSILMSRFLSFTTKQKKENRSFIARLSKECYHTNVWHVCHDPLTHISVLLTQMTKSSEYMAFKGGFHNDNVCVVSVYIDSYVLYGCRSPDFMTQIARQTICNYSFVK